MLRGAKSCSYCSHSPAFADSWHGYRCYRQVKPTVLALSQTVKPSGKGASDSAIPLSDEDLEGLRGCLPSRDEEVLLQVGLAVDAWAPCFWV